MLSINCKGRLVSLEKPVVMGILNITPDSFYEGSRFTHGTRLIDTAGKMLEEGATFLDLGGQSTRPGSEKISAAQELDRLLPAIKEISRHFPDAIMSVDSFYASVAKCAIEAGACLVNDISGGEIDGQMFETVATLKVPYVCMHMKGRPQDMIDHAKYDDVAAEVLDFFIKKVENCRKAGIHDVIIDPGFGFAKTIEHNFSLLKRLSLLKMLEVPVLVGLSRKSTIYKTLNITPDQALNGSTVMHTLALANGANILRVHDVKEAMEAINLLECYKNAK